MKKYAFFNLLIFVFTSGLAQSPNRRTGELIVQLDKNARVTEVLSRLNNPDRAVDQFSFLRPTAPDWGIYTLGFDESTQTAPDALAAVRRTKGVALAQLNFRTTERTEPNDQFFGDQWDMDLLGMPDAWISSTGGLTAQGDTIVVAVLEKGADLEHPDLVENRWVNYGEIPDDGIDNDANGYSDDFYGWDARNGGDGNGNGGSHGTAVNGIIGARGNNGKGVTGINWVVKLLNVSNTEYEDEIVAGYSYCAKLRQQYNQSNGTKGAFIVVTNASFGIDNENPNDHPLWCAVYDSLGKVGILSVGATTNSNTNVDVAGDMPTGCTSEYLVAVTNTSKADEKVVSAGWGPLSIDIGAPGNETFTTANPNSYGMIGGCSAAAPHVTGAIAFLYSLPCANIANDAKIAPSIAAERLRDIIYASGKTVSSLSDKTTTGKRLDVRNAATTAAELCGSAADQFEVTDFGYTPDLRTVHFNYRTPDTNEYPVRLFDTLGRLVYTTTLGPAQFSAGTFSYDMNGHPSGGFVLLIGNGKKPVVRDFIHIR